MFKGALTGPALILIGSCLLTGEDGPTALAFDVATAKKNIGHSGGYDHRISPEGITMQGVSMGYCIRLAYGLTAQRPYELVGPAWLDPPTDLLFDIAGKCDRPVSLDQIKLMLQNLLKERFKLAVHREKRDLPAYLLTLAKPETGLQPSNGGETKVRVGASHRFLFRNVSMAQLALQLGPPMTSRAVVDMTGLKGSFDFALDLERYMTDPETGRVIAGPNGRIDEEGAVLRGVRDQLGLTLKAGRAPMEVLVVDHVEKIPVEN